MVNLSNSDDPIVCHPPHYLHELPIEEEERLGNLFKQLDVDGNGKIDIHDLSVALKDSGVHQRYAQKFLEHSDQNKSGDVTLAEFIHYVKEHEKNLRLQFSSLDKNKDGRIDVEELMKAFNELGVEIERNEAANLLQRMDQDGSLNISFDEWRDFLLYAPSTDIISLIKYWRHATMCELGLHVGIRNIEEDLYGRNPSRMWNISEIDKDKWTADLSEVFAAVVVMQAHQQASVAVAVALPRCEACTHFLLALQDLYDRYLDIGEDMSVPDDFSQKEMVTGMWWRHLVAGGVAGAVSRTCTAPLDRLKVFLQVHGTKNIGMRSCLKHLFQEGGFWSFWRGNGINVVKIAPESAIKFMAYEQCKRLIRGNNTRELSIYERFVAGSLAGGISQTVIYPLEVLKTRLALRTTGQYKGIADAAKKIYKKEGLRSFYRGYVPNLLGIIPYAGIDLAVYETLKNSYLRKHSGDTPSVLLLLACGTVSSTCGQVCSYPLALVRTRLQAQVVTTEHGAAHAQPCTMSSLIRTIVQHEGFFGLYRGITPNFLKVAPAVSISYVVYERFRQTLGVNMT